MATNAVETLVMIQKRRKKGMNFGVRIVIMASIARPLHRRVLEVCDYDDEKLRARSGDTYKASIAQ